MGQEFCQLYFGQKSFMKEGEKWKRKNLKTRKGEEKEDKAEYREGEKENERSKKFEEKTENEKNK